MVALPLRAPPTRPLGALLTRCTMWWLQALQQENEELRTTLHPVEEEASTLREV